MRDPLDEASATADKVLAVGFSVVVNLGGERQVTLNGIMPFDMPAAVRNGMLDAVLALADRQKARYEIEVVEDELVKHRDALAQMTEDRARINTEHDHQQAVRAVELDERIKLRDKAIADQKAEMDAGILDLSNRREKYRADAETEHFAAGHRTAFKPRGQVEAGLRNMDAGLKNLAAARDKDLEQYALDYDAGTEVARGEIAKADNERDKALTNLDISAKRFGEAVLEREIKLAKFRKTVEG